MARRLRQLVVLAAALGVDPVAADINGDGGMIDVFPEAPAERPLLDYSAGGRIGP